MSKQYVSSRTLWCGLRFVTIFLLLLAVVTLPVAAEAHDHDDGTWIELTSSTTQLTADGMYYLKDDLKLQKTLVITADVTLCLNGNVLTVPSNNVILIQGGTLTLVDCKDTVHYFTKKDDGRWEWKKDAYNAEYEISGGVITGGTGVDIVGNGIKNGGGVHVMSDSVFNMYGGTIVGNKADNYGGGVGNSGVFNMYGGKIIGNTVRDDGAGVGNGGEFNMYGGTIEGNTAKDGGGGVYAFAGTFKMNGGEIKENTAVRGNGVFVSGGSFKMNGGDIKANFAGVACLGSGVYVERGIFILSGGDITKNTAYHGGGVYVGDTGSFMVSGGTIQGNQAEMGGGVLVAAGTITVSDTATIIDNVDKNGNANNVYLPSEKIIAINGQLTAPAKIGVTTKTEPTETDDVAITDNSESGNARYFTSDTSKYYVGYTDGKVSLTLTPPSEPTEEPTENPEIPTTTPTQTESAPTEQPTNAKSPGFGMAFMLAGLGAAVALRRK